MPPLDVTQSPRHARMFEFLRQSNQAELTTNRLITPPKGQAATQSLEDWCKLAIQSLRTHPGATRA